MRVILAIALLAVVCSAVKINLQERDYAIEFGRFVEKFNKQYVSDDEQGYRYRVFKANLDLINKHNSEGHSYKLAVNHFADLTNAEFKERYLGVSFNSTRQGAKFVPSNVEIPATVDWRTKGAVTPVKDQGQCGSCWSFSTTGSTEGAWFLKTGNLVSLSEQNLVDCSTAQGNNGCGGGLMDYAFTYIIQNKGIDTEESYPYTATDGNACQYTTANKGATISKYTDVDSGDEAGLAAAVATQPISVAIDASHSSFQFYSSGVYYEPDCSSDQLDHGVLAVGFGTESGTDYWLVKNSWNTSWGDQGYIKMSRNKDNNCGIATSASFPTI
eukprot:TRINITY_DN105_c0_g1_i6.p1 TRINITY_DN105_c0_g1~~TRINITY_DN105_c0_g1_i6.p1  ORF type:complete len:364 (-),score=159.12 TRINITY_DN105_c0_g1_i6:109-1092(-)